MINSLCPFLDVFYWVSKLGPLIVMNVEHKFYSLEEGYVYDYMQYRKCSLLSLMNEEERHSCVVEIGLLDFEE